MARAVQAIAGVIFVVVGTFIPGMQNPALVKFGWALIVSNVLSEIALALAGKPKFRRYGADQEYNGTVEPRRIVYGTLRVSGMNAIPPWTSGGLNQWLHQVLVIAGHEVSSIGSVYFNQTEISGAASPQVISPVAGASGDGLVVSGDYANRAWIRRWTGAADQTADYILTNQLTGWTSDHRGRGVAYLALQYEFDNDVYSTGRPEVSCLVDGKMVYDPRLDASPGAAPTNASYIAFSSNPALCLADYLLDADLGLGDDAAHIDWDLVVAAANICDELVAIPPASSPSSFQPRYTCNTVLFAATEDSDRRKNIETLVTAMMGHVVYRNGAWRMYAGAASSSVYDITEDDIVGKVSIRTELPSSEKYNFVRGQFVDADRDYQLVEFNPAADASYETADGDRKPLEVMFSACTDKYEAQRNAIITLKRSRLKRQVSVDLGFGCYRIKPWDVCTMTLAEIGWDQQEVRCMSWDFNQAGFISATFLEEDSTAWADPVVNEYYTPTSPGDPGSGLYIPLPPTSFSVTPIVDGILFNWTPDDRTVPGTTYRVLEHTAATPFSSSSAIAMNISGTSYTAIKTDTTTRYYWVKAFYIGQGSSEVPLGDGAPGAALAVTDTGVRAALTTNYLYKQVTGTSTATTASVTASGAGGTPGYTYAWARTSGDATISANSATSATTTFSCTGLINEEVNSAVFTCTVTDSASPQDSDVRTITVTCERQDYL